MQTEFYYVLGGLAFVVLLQLIILVLISCLSVKVKFLRLQSQEVKNRVDNLRNPDFRKSRPYNKFGGDRKPPQKPQSFGAGTWTPDGARSAKTFKERPVPGGIR